MNMTKLSIRKTLILGLGTTGREIAENVAEQLTWRYGSLDNTPWVRLLVAETEKPETPLGDRMIHIGIDAFDYDQYRSNPKTKGDEFDFFDWQDGKCLKNITDASVGAGNLRMLGRLCLFHSPNYTKLQARVKRELDSLRDLTKQQIAQALGNPSLEVTEHPDTVVYVVGTLCGGTGSGGCADWGYLIRNWSGERAKVQAIFTLPHQTSGNQRFKKNAYYALKELNHYQLAETQWRQKLPGQSEPQVYDKPPYDLLRVCMPSGAQASDITALNSLVAQYLAAAVGAAGEKIAALDVNALSQITGEDRIGYMRPLFSSMGAAALEFPGEHVLSALSDRLMASTLNAWLTNTVTPLQVQEAMGLVGSDFDGMVRRLIDQSGERFDVGLHRKIEAAGKDGTPPKVTEIRRLIQQTDLGVTTQTISSDGENALIPLVQVIDNNQKRLLENIEQEVDKILEGGLFDLGRGPGFVLKVLRGYIEKMEAWAKERDRRLPDLQEDARSLRQRMDESLEAMEKIERSKNPFAGNKEKLRHEWEVVNRSAEQWLEMEVQVRAFGFMEQRDTLNAIIKQLRNVTATRVRRLEKMEAAFQQEANRLDALWRKKAQEVPVMNGVVYFTPETSRQAGTVTQRYYEQLKQCKWSEEPATFWDEEQKERRAQRELLKTLEPLGELLSRAEQGSFDDLPGSRNEVERIPAQIKASFVESAKSYFESLSREIHIAQLAQDADLDAVIQRSEPSLKVSGTQLSDKLRQVRGIAPKPQEIALLSLTPNAAATPEDIARLKDKIEIRLPTSAHRTVTDSGDPFRLTIIRERHGFTLGQMEGVIRKDANDLSSLESAESCTDFTQWHTRIDVDWVNPLITPDQVNQAEENWLLILSLGRANDAMFPWMPSFAKEIDEKGWYTLSEGNFRVYHQPGAIQLGATEEVLPLEFDAAIGKLLQPRYATLLSGMKTYLSDYQQRYGAERLTLVVEQSLAALHSFGVKGLDGQRANKIFRRACARNPALTRALFALCTRTMEKGQQEFSRLYRREGEAFEKAPDKVAPADGYYCHYGHPQGKNREDLLDKQFRCTACHTGEAGEIVERYWP